MKDSTTTSGATTSPTITGRLVRRTAGRRPTRVVVTAADGAPPAGPPAAEAAAIDAKPPRAPRARREAPQRLARLLALAYRVEAAIETGELKHHAEAARRLGVTRARMSQVAALRWLPIEEQEEILRGRATTSEHGLRALPGNAATP